MTSVRLKVDPAIGVMDLERVFREFLRRQEDKNLFSHLVYPGGGTYGWKTSPNVQWISGAAELLVGFLKIAPNGVLPSSKVRMCLQRLLADPVLKLNRTEYCSEDLVDQIDNRLRIMLKQCRELKRAEAYMCAMRKATEDDKTKVDLVLSHLEVPASAANEQQACTALVPYSGGAGAPAVETSSPRKIFKRMLARSFSSPDRPATPSIAAASSSAAASSDAFCIPKKHQPMIVGPGISSSDSETVAKPGMARVPVAKSKSGSGKAKGNTYGLDDKDLEFVESSLEAKVPSGSSKKAQGKKQAQPKKKVAYPKGKSKVCKKPAMTTEALDEMAAVSEEEQMEDGPAEVAEPEEPKKKCSFKHRLTSSVYAKERKMRLKMGASPETAKRHARAAASEASAKIDAGLLKEK